MSTALRDTWNLELLETDAGDGHFNADGTVDFALIRPCNGRGKGNRIYLREVLARDAHKFSGVGMYRNHDSDAAKLQRGGLPRSPEEIGGHVLKAWWDPTYRTSRDAEEGFDRGAVIGRCRLLKDMEELVRKAPQLLKVSINARATKLTPGTRNGKKGMIVEGIKVDATSSVDLVTAAGAGGQVAALVEASIAGAGQLTGDAAAFVSEVARIAEAAAAEVEEHKAWLQAQYVDSINDAVEAAILDLREELVARYDTVVESASGRRRGHELRHVRRRQPNVVMPAIAADYLVETLEINR